MTNPEKPDESKKWEERKRRYAEIIEKEYPEIHAKLQAKEIYPTRAFQMAGLIPDRNQPGRYKRHPKQRKRKSSIPYLVEQILKKYDHDEIKEIIRGLGYVPKYPPKSIKPPKHNQIFEIITQALDNDKAMILVAEGEAEAIIGINGDVEKLFKEACDINEKLCLAAKHAARYSDTPETLKSRRERIYAIKKMYHSMIVAINQIGKITHLSLDQSAEFTRNMRKHMIILEDGYLAQIGYFDWIEGEELPENATHEQMKKYLMEKVPIEEEDSPFYPLIVNTEPVVVKEKKTDKEKKLNMKIAFIKRHTSLFQKLDEVKWDSGHGGKYTAVKAIASKAKAIELYSSKTASVDIVQILLNTYREHVLSKTQE